MSTQRPANASGPTPAKGRLQMAIAHGNAGGLSAFEALAQERRTGAELYLQGRHYHYRLRLCRSGVARRQGHARQMIRVIVLMAVVLPAIPAHAIPCWVVRKAVAQYGEAAVESWARAKGISDKEIERARRCLK